jgi:hypothetical protein
MSEITREEFEAWRQNAVTEAVFDTLRQNIDDARQQWLAGSWDTGTADQRLLDDLRGGASFARTVLDMTYEDLVGADDQDK